MKPDTSDDEIEEQSANSLLSDPEQFDAFDTANSEVSNGKSRDGGGELTHLTDLTANRKGVYVAGAPARARARPRRHTSPPLSRCQIRQIRQIAGRRRGKNGCFHPPGVKSVKWPPVSPTEVIL